MAELPVSGPDSDSGPDSGVTESARRQRWPQGRAAARAGALAARQTGFRDRSPYQPCTCRDTVQHVQHVQHVQGSRVPSRSPGRSLQGW